MSETSSPKQIDKTFQRFHELDMNLRLALLSENDFAYAAIDELFDFSNLDLCVFLRYLVDATLDFSIELPLIAAGNAFIVPLAHFSYLSFPARRMLRCATWALSRFTKLVQ